MKKRNTNKDLISEAVKFRYEGKTVKEISEILNKPKTTVKHWVEGIILTPEQRQNIRHATLYKTHNENSGVIKYKEFLEAKRLRTEDGLPLHVIAKKLGVAKSTVGLWLKNVQLTKEQKERLYNNNGFVNPLFGNRCMQQKYLEVRKKSQMIGRKKMKQRNPDYVAGCMLYWAEGTKNRTSVAFTNCDVNMHKVFIGFLLEQCNVKKENIRMFINCYLDNGLTLLDIENYWLKELDLPKTCLTKATIKNNISKAKNKWIYGVCRITVHDVCLMQEIYGAIQEYAGFDCSEWLLK